MNFLLLLCCLILIFASCKLVYKLILSLCKFVYKIIHKTLDKEKKSSLKESIDIITYKEENGIIYGYFNQPALDLALYNRAKETTNNFTTKNQYSNENSKKDVQLKDISIQKHSILHRTVSNREYVYAGDVILDIGLEHLSSSNYFDRNNIFQYETGLCYGIKIFSKYDGYFEYKTSENSDDITDGDLLFTIQLAENPQEIESYIKKVKFNYNLLDNDFVKKTLCLSDLYLTKWLLSDYSYVNKGDNIMEISEHSKFTQYMIKVQGKTIVKSPYSGILVYDIKPDIASKKLNKGSLLCTIYTDDLSIMEDRFKYQFNVNEDDFTKKTIISCKFLSETLTTSLYTSLGIRLTSYLNLNFEWVEDKCYIVLSYDNKEIRLDKNFSFLMLFDNGNVLSLNPEIKPSNNICRLRLSTTDMNVLENSLFTKWRIIDKEGNILVQGKNNCCSHIPTSDNNSKNISSIAFQKFIRDFRKVIKENVSIDKLEEQENEITINNSCYVYLMIDTTNNFHKIGISNNPKYREHTLQSDKPTIELLCAKEYPSRDIATAIESSLHQVYATKRIRGEWFNLEETDIENIKQTLK